MAETSPFPSVERQGIGVLEQPGSPRANAVAVAAILANFTGA